MSLAQYFTAQQQSCESASPDGHELEISYIGKIVDPQDILTGTGCFENQEQYRVLFELGDLQCSLRCRRSREGRFFEGGDIEWKDPKYTMTYKSYIKGNPDTTEVESEISEAQGIRLMADLKAHGGGMVKRRYFFNVGKGFSDGKGSEVIAKCIIPEGMIWEVDTFPVSGELPPETHGTAMYDFQPWVKFDMEVPEFNSTAKALSKILPFKTTDMEWAQHNERTAEDRVRIDGIIRQYMTAKK